MSDDMRRYRELSDKAKELEAEEKFAQAADLYKQAYDLYPSAFVASRYIRCLRNQGKSLVAVDFGRQLPKQLLNDSFVHNAVSWAIYDVYLKKAENIDDNEFNDVGHDKLSNSDFDVIQKRAQYILKKSSATDDILRTRTVFAICNEAKQRGKPQVMYDFACQLDPERLSSEQKEWNGRKLPSDYQRWLYMMVRSLLELNRYDECMEFARKGSEKVPREKLFYWWQACIKKALGQVEEALGDLERIDTRFPKEWYIQRDIADGYAQLQKYDDAWVWFCKAADCPGDRKGRFKMFEQMSMLLEQRGCWQEAYDHLQLAYAIIEKEKWDHPAEVLQGKLVQFRKRHAAHMTFPTNTSIEIGPNLQRCRVQWQETIHASHTLRKGYIKRLQNELGYGFIRADNDDIHFRFRDVINKVTPVEGMEVEFEIVKSYDEKKQRDSTKAVNIRPVRKHSN